MLINNCDMLKIRLNNSVGYYLSEKINAAILSIFFFSAIHNEY